MYEQRTYGSVGAGAGNRPGYPRDRARGAFQDAPSISRIGASMVVFSDRMRPEVTQPFWAAIQRGEFISAAAESVGTYRVKGRRWILAEHGIRPRRGRDLKGRCLTFSEREEIALGRARGSRCGASPDSWGAHRQPSRASSHATPTGAASTGRPARTRWRGSEPVVPSRPSSGSTSGYERSSSSCLSAGTLPSRSPGACACNSLLTRRCGCQPRRSTSHSM